METATKNTLAASILEYTRGGRWRPAYFFELAHRSVLDRGLRAVAVGQTHAQTFGTTFGPLQRRYHSHFPKIQVPKANRTGKCTEPVLEPVRMHIPPLYAHRQVSKRFA